MIKWFNNFIPIHSSPNILNEEDIDIVIGEIINNDEFEESDVETETFESIEDLKYPQDNNGWGIIILDDLNEKELCDPLVQAVFKRSRHFDFSIFFVSQGYYDLLKRTIRANGEIFFIFKPNTFRDVQNVYQDKTSMDTTLDGFKLLTSICWNEK